MFETQYMLSVMIESVLIHSQVSMKLNHQISKNKTKPKNLLAILREGFFNPFDKTAKRFIIGIRYLY